MESEKEMKSSPKLQDQQKKTRAGSKEATQPDTATLDEHIKGQTDGIGKAHNLEQLVYGVMQFAITPTLPIPLRLPPLCCLIIGAACIQTCCKRRKLFTDVSSSADTVVCLQKPQVLLAL